MMAYREYKVEVVTEGGCSTVVLGASAFPAERLSRYLTEQARDGWQLAFMVVETRRFLLFWAREAVIVTLAR
jgi:hypothetical protein